MKKLEVRFSFDWLVFQSQITQSNYKVIKILTRKLSRLLTVFKTVGCFLYLEFILNVTFHPKES